VTAIEWTDATWNPVTGCSKVSPGCAHCYAETLSHRWQWTTKPWTPEHAAENVVLHPERLSKPLSWRKPRMIFVNSMSDLFHELVPFEFITEVFDVMVKAKHHTFQVLTKRPERMAEFMKGYWHGGDPSVCVCVSPTRPARNIWLGTSIENDRWTGRADILREIPAAVRFISAEPLLGPLPSLNLTGIHWLIVGGESGANHRPISEEWVRKLRDACIATRVRGSVEMNRSFGTAFFFKQWGGRTPKSGGRLLDGREWSEYPA
jgi:protein gp37